LVAAFPDAHLGQGGEGMAGAGTAVVTNRRVIFAGRDRQPVREWPLDEVDPEGHDQPQVIDLTDGSALDLPDRTTGSSLAAAISAASRARQSSQ
jgi:hypothetical protein